jgi:hypothetical protein
MASTQTSGSATTGSGPHSDHHACIALELNPTHTLSLIDLRTNSNNGDAIMCVIGPSMPMVEATQSHNEIHIT